MVYTIANSMSTISMAMEDAMRRHLAELMAIQQLSLPPLLRMDNTPEEGNVLAIVNFPADPGRDCNGIAEFGKTYQLRLEYTRLVGLRSTKINDMLKPKKQDRFRRLLRMETLPDGVDYVLDFTPPSEGEECSELTASLWLPECTKMWWMAGHYKPSSLLEMGPNESGLHKRPLADKPPGAVLTLGHDDQCSCAKTYSNISELWAQRDDVPGVYDGEHWVPDFRREIKDYCRVRHCMNTLRILRAIAGEDLLVNSATRMWTLANLAVHLDVVSVVRDSITQWFSAAPNTKFIEMFPEESFKMALSLQMRDVLLMSFKILVNERAVDQAATTCFPRPPKTTWMERDRTDYGDLPEDPIEHASRAFADRMKTKLDLLRSDKVFDSMDDGVGEWGKLQYYSKVISETSAATAQPDPALLSLLEKLLKLMEALLHIFHTHITVCLFRGPKQWLENLIIAQRAHYIPQQKQTSVENLLARLNDGQKACLPFFWYHLRDSFPEVHHFRYQPFQKTYLKNIAEDFNDELENALDRHLLELDRPALYRQAGSFVPVPLPFSDETFHAQLANRFLAKLSNTAIGNPDLDTLSFLMSDHLLLTLEESETKYLPLWAGGFDDGSGGVFQDDVPPTDMGPSEPGPQYHTGHTVASDMSSYNDADSTVGGYAPSSSSFSDLGVGNLKLASSGGGTLTTGRGLSNVAQDSGASTVYARSEVISLADSEAFTSGDDASMREAMVAVPAEHLPLGRAVAHYVEGLDAGDREMGGIDGKKEGEKDGDGVFIFEDEEGDDDDAMDTDSTLSAGFGEEEGDDDFDLV